MWCQPKKQNGQDLPASRLARVNLPRGEIGIRNFRPRARLKLRQASGRAVRKKDAEAAPNWILRSIVQQCADPIPRAKWKPQSASKQKLWQWHVKETSFDVVAKEATPPRPGPPSSQQEKSEHPGYSELPFSAWNFHMRSFVHFPSPHLLRVLTAAVKALEFSGMATAPC